MIQRRIFADTRKILTLAAVAALFNTAFTTIAPAGEASGPKPFQLPNARLEPTAFATIRGWATDNHVKAFETFLTSCGAILRSTEKLRRGRPPLYTALYHICQDGKHTRPQNDDSARTFFERHFSAFRIASLEDRDGFITGYYEPVVEGSREPTDIYNVPLYRRPPNMLAQRLRGHRGPIGKKAVWRKKRTKAAPYFDRTQIEEGALAGRGLEICYLKDPEDAFFAQIQGSVRVRLQDGSMLRLNYDASNGHAYTAIGRFLIERNIIARQDMSMQRIREWMQANPDEAKALRRENKSYVFFRETELTHEDEAVGAQGLSLTPLRSIAVDRKLHVYGTPFFIDALLPIVSDQPETAFRRLMIAQDTGGAIVGPARADIYYGSGDDAERIAGRLKNAGRFFIFVPKELDPAVIAAKIPLPKPRPATAKIASSGKKP